LQLVLLQVVRDHWESVKDGWVETRKARRTADASVDISAGTGTSGTDTGPSMLVAGRAEAIAMAAKRTMLGTEKCMIDFGNEEARILLLSCVVEETETSTKTSILYIFVLCILEAL
jgi:hypothetical protein